MPSRIGIFIELYLDHLNNWNQITARVREFTRLARLKMTRQNKLLTLVNNRVRVILKDGRIILGRLLAFDKYMNLVVADSQEHRNVKIPKAANGEGGEKQLERALGLIVLRGENIISCCLETGIPPSGFENRARPSASQPVPTGLRPAPMMVRPGMMAGMPPGMHQ